MAHVLTDQHLKTYKDVQKWISQWFSLKPDNLFWDGIHKLPERREKCVANNGYILHKIFLMYILKLTCICFKKT